jgi:osmotically-inducible protein OsmY
VFDDDVDDRRTAYTPPPRDVGITHDSHAASSRNVAAPSFRGRGPRDYARTDSRIREHVCEALTDHEAIDASDIEVSVESAEVTLAGSVPNRAMKRAAEIVTENCRGVQRVSNLLRARSRGEAL